ncbi:hypothetical protein WCE10_21745, partial [Cronobacter muytjensii]|uniref:hypothetical protein n=1 Tax=Cronobacter muytjensii TaxID=413501 RepID=UPI0034D67CB9
MRPQVFITHTPGIAVDFTLRIGLPQMERDRLTSPIKTSAKFTGRGSVATYWDSNGVLQTAAAGVERMSYNPKNLYMKASQLWEGSATNVIRNNTMQ